MQKFHFLDKKIHGTVEFPVEYYYVDDTHARYHMAFHWHKEWELLRVLDGTFHLTLNDEHFTLNAEDIVLLPGETLHGGEPVDCTYECLVFDLYNLFSKNESLKTHLRPFYRGDIIPERFFTNEDFFPASILDIFNQGTSPCTELECFSAISGFFAWIIKNKFYTGSSVNDQWFNRIKPVLEYIEEHYNENISLDVLASVAGMNPRYFCRVFFSLTHTTPMNYVNLFRIEQAAYFLDSTDSPITTIASDCGFWESSYFTKVFKKYKHTTPKNYRNIARIVKSNRVL